MFVSEITSSRYKNTVKRKTSVILCFLVSLAYICVSDVRAQIAEKKNLLRIDENIISHSLISIPNTKFSIIRI